MIWNRRIRKLLVRLGLTFCGLCSATIPALAAEHITFLYPPFGEFSIAVADLEVFAKEGRVTPSFAFYLNRVSPEQRQHLQTFLQQRFQMTPVYVSQFTYSPLGEKLFERLGDLVQTDARANGLYALRSALILSAADKSEGLTAVNVLRRFPSNRIRLNLNAGLSLVDSLSELLQRRDIIVRALNQLSASEAAKQPIDARQLDLRSAGAVLWHKQSFDVRDRDRDRAVPFDLYLPETSSPAPVIVISHGVAENRLTFAYLAEHLASYGFAVIAIAHTGGDSTRLQRYFAGLAAPPPATEFLDRPRDVSYVLDELQRRAQTEPIQGRLNLQNVGVIGHSLGGYTTLALAGATLNFEQVQKDCNPNRSLNLSIMLQCRVSELPRRQYTLQDARIKAVFAVNPLASTLFSQQGMSQIQVPVALVGGSEDIFTPAVPEQIRPFTWLQTPNKYLVLIEKGTHFSAEMQLKSDEQVFPLPTSLAGIDPTLAHGYMKALSLAFFQTHLANQSEFQPYLSASYGRFLSQVPLNLSVLGAAHNDRILQILQSPTQSLTSAN